MDDRGKAQIQAIGAGLLGFGLIFGMGVFFIIPRGASLPATFAPRDTAGIFAPKRNPARPIPVTAPAGVEASIATLATPAEPAGSPAPLLSDELRPDAVSASAASGAAIDSGREATTAASSAPGLIASASLGTSAPNSVSAAVTAATEASAAKAAAAAPAGTAKAATARVSGSVVAAAAVVHYGSSDRSQLMERGAGPVYNFGSIGAKADPIAGAMQDVLAAQQKINGLGVSDSDKAALQQNTAQFQQAAAQADAAVQQATIQAGAPAPGH